MKHHACVQGTEQWRMLRCGIPTASEFHRIIQPKKWEPTKGETRRAFALHLLTERILGMPLDGPTTASMLHGNNWESKARAAYAMLTGLEVEPCGFCTNDEGTAGASPDTLIGDEGLCQIKCPEKPEVHVGYLMEPQSLVEDHWVQLQGELYICSDRKWNDIISYFGGMPMVTVRVEPHPEFQAKLDVALRSFVCELSDMVERANKAGWIAPKPEQPDQSREWITQEDVDAILAARRTQEANGQGKHQDIVGVA